jgi:hypothetical protein
MVFALVADISADPIEIFRAKTQDAVTGLPLQGLEAKSLIGLVARRAFQLPTSSLIRIVGAIVMARWMCVSIPPTRARTRREFPRGAVSGSGESIVPPAS